MTPEFNLELLNGNWAIAALSLAVICFIYLWHELYARLEPGRTLLTQGMRVAIAVFTLSAGVFIRSAEVWWWRLTSGDLHNLSQDRLSIGGIVAIIGFLCAIREISSPLYGRAPWLYTVAAMTVFTIGSIVHHFMI